MKSFRRLNLAIVGVFLALAVFAPRPDLQSPNSHPWIPDGPNPILAALHKVLYLGGSLQWVGNFALFIPVAWLLVKGFPKLSALNIFLICVGLSAMIEIAQLFVPGRVSDIRDWLANSAGAALTIFILKRQNHSSLLLY